MKIFLFTSILLLIAGCSSSMPVTHSSQKTILEKHMDFNTTYYTLDEYQKKFYKKLNSQKEYAWLTSKDLTLLYKNKEIKKNQYYHDKKISLNKYYTNVLHAIKDTNFIQYMQKKDKTSKLSLVILMC